MLAKVLDDHLHLLRDVVIVQHHPLAQPDFGPVAVHFTVFIFQFLQELIRHFIAGVVFQHIENKAFLNGLTHGVYVECRRFIGGRCRFAWVRETTKKLQRFGLRRGGERIIVQVAAVPTRGKGGVKAVF